MFLKSKKAKRQRVSKTLIKTMQGALILNYLYLVFYHLKSSKLWASDCILPFKAQGPDGGHMVILTYSRIILCGADQSSYGTEQFIIMSLVQVFGLDHNILKELRRCLMCVCMLSINSWMSASLILDPVSFPMSLKGVSTIPRYFLLICWDSLPHSFQF